MVPRTTHSYCYDSPFVYSFRFFSKASRLLSLSALATACIAFMSFSPSYFCAIFIVKIGARSSGCQKQVEVRVPERSKSAWDVRLNKSLNERLTRFIIILHRHMYFNAGSARSSSCPANPSNVSKKYEYLSRYNPSTHHSAAPHS